MPGSSKCFLSFRFLHQNPVHTSSISPTCYMSRPFHSTRFDHPIDISRAVPFSQINVSDQGLPFTRTAYCNRLDGTYYRHERVYSGIKFAIRRLGRFLRTGYKGIS
jgi:hypothetical protein